jgi:hypothetical protein
MSLSSHCAVDIIARFIDMATKLHDGKRLGLILSHSPAHCGSKHIRSGPKVRGFAGFRAAGPGLFTERV